MPFCDDSFNWVRFPNDTEEADAAAIGRVLFDDRIPYEAVRDAYNDPIIGDPEMLEKLEAERIRLEILAGL